MAIGICSLFFFCFLSHPWNCVTMARKYEDISRVEARRIPSYIHQSSINPELRARITTQSGATSMLVISQTLISRLCARPTPGPGAMLLSRHQRQLDGIFYLEPPLLATRSVLKQFICPCPAFRWACVLFVWALVTLTCFVKSYLNDTTVSPGLAGSCDLRHGPGMARCSSSR